MTDQLQVWAGMIFIIANILDKHMSYGISVSSQEPTAAAEERLQGQILRDKTQLWLLIYFLNLKASIPKLTSILSSTFSNLPAKEKPIKSSRTED